MMQSGFALSTKGRELSSLCVNNQYDVIQKLLTLSLSINNLYSLNHPKTRVKKTNKVYNNKTKKPKGV